MAEGQWMLEIITMWTCRVFLYCKMPSVGEQMVEGLPCAAAASPPIVLQWKQGALVLVSTCIIMGLLVTLWHLAAIPQFSS
jgi:hypothetical protein